MDKTVVKWDISLDDSISAMGFIVGEEDPAIGVEGRFSKQEETKKFSEELIYLKFMAEEQSKGYTFEVGEEVFAELREQQMVVGPALIPNKLILRVDEEGNPFYGYFTEDAVRNAQQSFQKYKLQDKFNINHDQEDYVDGMFITETWIVRDSDNDASKTWGYKLPVGSWFITLKIQNKEIYDQYVASGEFKGFSIETQLSERVVFNKVTEACEVVGTD